jgi:hypothetical protein
VIGNHYTVYACFYSENSILMVANQYPRKTPVLGDTLLHIGSLESVGEKQVNAHSQDALTFNDNGKFSYTPKPWNSLLNG